MPVVMMAGPSGGAGDAASCCTGAPRRPFAPSRRAAAISCSSRWTAGPSKASSTALLPNRRVATAASAQESNRCLYQIVGKSPRMLQTIALAERIAPTSVPVLISGESGTGKELISLLIHHKSRRALGPFVRVNCAALSDSLLESELFGHEKGAFTGAYAQRKGRFEMAHGGTLLLDEITETPPTFQAKLLRIIEQQEFERVGGNENIKVNVRIISTTNRDLLHEVQMGRFRQDLYYRLSAARIVAAPLRERRDDLPELIWHFVNLYAQEAQRRIETLDPTMMEIFAKYHWPGNVRQLRNVVLTSLILGAGPVLSLADVSWLFDELQPLTESRKVATLEGSMVETRALVFLRSCAFRLRSRGAHRARRHSAGRNRTPGHSGDAATDLRQPDQGRQGPGHQRPHAAGEDPPLPQAGMRGEPGRQRAASGDPCSRCPETR